MPEILSLALFERSKRVLLARRKDDQRPPFAGRWVLPAATVRGEETAEEALERHAYKELGVEVDEVEFAETLYLEDEATADRYVANVFAVRRYREALRVRVAGDYEDARWLSGDDLAGLDAPAALLDWLTRGRHQPAPPVVARLPVADEAPDNRAGWNAISKAYQARYRLPTDRVLYGGRSPDESELGLLGDVDGRQVIVLGCGGGQECIALAKQRAQVVGVDLSDEQIAYGRRLADDEGVFVTLEQGNVEDLKGVDDERFDLAVSLQALDYVERIDLALAEARRVLRPGAAFVLSVHHPFDACLEDAPPYGLAKSYWQAEVDWRWEFQEGAVSARLRSWYRPVSEWFSLLTAAGFRVERLLEPAPVAADVEPWRYLGSTPQKAELAPETLIVKAEKE